MTVAMAHTPFCHHFLPPLPLLPPPAASHACQGTTWGGQGTSSRGLPTWLHLPRLKLKKEPHPRTPSPTFPFSPCQAAWEPAIPAGFPRHGVGQGRMSCKFKALSTPCLGERPGHQETAVAGWQVPGRPSAVWRKVGVGGALKRTANY